MEYPYFLTLRVKDTIKDINIDFTITKEEAIRIMVLIQGCLEKDKK